MKKIILGHCNAVLAILIDIIYKDTNTIDIISNMTNDDNSPYLIEDISTNEYTHDKYDYNQKSDYILGVNSPKSKNSVYNFFNTYYQITIDYYCNIIAPNVCMPYKLFLGNGILINNNVTIAPYTKIGNFVTINRNCSIGHHNNIGDFVTISPGVNIAGYCKVGDNTTIGIGATIINNICIGKNVVIGAGSVVTKDVPDNCVYYGVPAKFIRLNN